MTPARVNPSFCLHWLSSCLPSARAAHHHHDHQSPMPTGVTHEVPKVQSVDRSLIVTRHSKLWVVYVACAVSCVTVASSQRTVIDSTLPLFLSVLPCRTRVPTGVTHEVPKVQSADHSLMFTRHSKLWVV